jgi:glycosyltransferase involved in cell wall biosynthesis
MTNLADATPLPDEQSRRRHRASVTAVRVAEPKASICMFVYNACVSDARVLKEATTLSAAGHRVEVVAVRDKTSPPTEHRDGFTIVRIDRDPIHYRVFRVQRKLARRVAFVRARLTSIPLRVARRASARAFTDVRNLPHPVLLAAILALPARVYRYARWRVLQFVPPIRRKYYRHRSRRFRAAQASQVGTVHPGSRGTGVIATILLAPSRLLWWPLGLVGRCAARLCRRGLMAFHKPLMFIDYYKRAYRHARAQSFDVFHAHDLITLPVAVVLARRSGARLVYDSHELYPEISTLRSAERLIWMLVERLLIRQADAVITVCESITNELRMRYGIPKPVTLLNCPPRINRPDGSRNLLRAKVGLPEGDSAIVLYQGGFVPNRGLAELIAAARYVDGAFFILMGWGRLEAEVRDLVKEHGVADRVIVTGPVPQDELLAFTAGADLGVIPYQAVGLNNFYATPNKLFEYMGAGLAVAGSRFPELRRFIEGLEIGRTFDPSNPRDIAFTINALLADRAVLEAMKENSRRAAERFVWEVESTKLLRVYGNDARAPEPSPLDAETGTRVWMLVRNPCTHDARVLKEAKTLAAEGYRVRIIAIRRLGLPEREYRDGFDIIRVPVMPPHYRFLRWYRRQPTVAKLYRQLRRSARLTYAPLRRNALRRLRIQRGRWAKRFRLAPRRWIIWRATLRRSLVTSSIGRLLRGMGIEIRPTRPLPPSRGAVNLSRLWRVVEAAFRLAVLGGRVSGRAVLHLLRLLSWAALTLLALASRVRGAMIGGGRLAGTVLANWPAQQAVGLAVRRLGAPIRLGRRAPRMADNRILRDRMATYVRGDISHGCTLDTARNGTLRLAAFSIWAPTASIAAFGRFLRLFAKLLLKAAQVFLRVLLQPIVAARQARPCLYEVLRQTLLKVHRPMLLYDYTRRTLALIEQEVAAEGGADRTDIIHAHDLNTLIAATKAARRRNARVVYDSHELQMGVANVIERGALTRAFLRFYEARYIKRVDATITVNDSISRILHRQFDIDPPLVIRNCPELVRAPRRRSRHLQRELGIPAGRRIALYHGNLSAHRGLENFVNVAEHLDDVALVLMGSGALQQELGKQIARRRLEGRVFLHDAVPAHRLLEYVASADVGVIPIQTHVPNYFYSLPNKLFDCLMAGRPVAAAFLPEIERIVTAYGVGSVFEPELPENIAHAITAVLDDSDYRGMCERAREAAVSFCWERDAPVLCSIYESLGAKADRAPAAFAPHVEPLTGAALNGAA